MNIYIQLASVSDDAPGYPMDLASACRLRPRPTKRFLSRVLRRGISPATLRGMHERKRQVPMQSAFEVPRESLSSLGSSQAPSQIRGALRARGFRGPPPNTLAAIARPPAWDLIGQKAINVFLLRPWNI